LSVPKDMREPNISAMPKAVAKRWNHVSTTKRNVQTAEDHT
jgi:hypothetical protein